MKKQNSRLPGNQDDDRDPTSLSVFKTPPERIHGSQAFDAFLAKFEAERERRLDADIARLKSPAGVRAWQAAVRRRLSDFLGEFPDRTPLRVRRAGKLDFPGVSVEKIILESRPNYYVTANFYLPVNRPLPLPGILLSCGHLPSGKTGEYGDAAYCMALKGYATMVFDPTGQGERSECINRRTGRHLVERTVCQHHWTGKPCLLTGTTLAGYRAWDGIRCIDYLLTRREIDPARIGVMGNSGGGAMTLLIAAVDARVAACAASHPGGSCENMLLRGSMPPAREIYALLAPRPCRIIVGDKSNEETRHRVKFNIMQPFYEACGCPERLELALVEGYHDLRMPKIVASCEWFNRWFGLEDEERAEPKRRRIAARRLWCTRKGQVQLSLGGETMASLNRARAAKIAPRRQAPGNAKAARRQRRVLRRALKVCIGFKRATGPLNARLLGTTVTEKFAVQRCVYESEPGMPIPALLFTPAIPRPGAPVLIHASEEGKPTALAPASLPVRLAGRGYGVLSIDARDTGEGALCAIPRFPDKRNGKLCAYNPQLFRRELLAMRALGLGRSRTGMRALDIIRAVDFLKEQGLLENGCVAAGEGVLGVGALQAAACDARLAGAVAVRTMPSYRLLTDNAYYNQFQYFWTPGVLAHYDIPDLPALVAPRPVALIAAVDHMTRIMNPADARRLFAHARAFYSVAGCPDNLIVKAARGLPSICRNVAEVMELAGRVRRRTNR